jgi:multiple sugar transport system substrate-binding protein
MSKRYRATLSIATATALVLSGCGGVGGGDDDGAAPTLTTMGFGAGDEIATVRVELADKAIAPASVKLGESAFDAQQFLSAVASDNAPDLVFMDRQLLGTYAARGTLEPLTDCVERENIDLDQYRDPALAEVTLDDTLYGLPEFYNNRVILINDSVVRGLGMDPATVTTTDRDALATAAGALTQTSGDGLARIGFDPKIPEFLPMWAKANGVEMLSEDGRTANLDDPKLVAALDYAVGLINAQGGWGKVKAFRDSFDFFGDQNPFATGQLAASPMDDWYLNVLGEVSPDLPFTVTPFTDPQGEPVDWATGNAWAIPAKSKHKDEACRWIRTMSDAPTWIAAAKARAEKRKADGQAFTGVYTGNEVADETIFGELVQLSDQPVYDKAVKAVLEAQNSAFTMPASPAGSEFKAAWEGAANRVLSGQQTAEEALKQAQQEAQQALDAAPGGN